MKPNRIEYTPRLFASICGLEGAGKTEFLCSAPDPILFLGIDPNCAETVAKVQDEKRIEYHEVRLPGIAFGGRDDVQDDAEEAWESFTSVLKPIVQRKTKAPGTIAIDTGTEFFELLLMADHGKAHQILPELRTKTNARWKSLLTGLKQAGCHVLLSHRLKDVYESKTIRTSQGPREERVKVPGVYEREGFNKTAYSVNVEVHLAFDADRADAKGDTGQGFGMRIVRCTSQPQLIGREVWGLRKDGTRRVSFDGLMRLVYPDA